MPPLRCADTVSGRHGADLCHLPPQPPLAPCRVAGRPRGRRTKTEGRMLRPALDKRSGPAHVRSMTMFGLHTRFLLFAGNTLNRR